MRTIYLDNNATTRPLPGVVCAVSEAMLAIPGNPSSPHSAGARALSAVEQARCEVAGLVGADPKNLFFVSGGTEANNIVLRSFFASDIADLTRRLVTTSVEHSSVLNAAESIEAQGFQVTRLSVDADGFAQLEDLDRLLPTTALCSVQWVNNETGVVQPIHQICELCTSHNVPLHVDAAQAVGKIHIDFASSRIDFLTFSGHKLHGPLGIGALLAREPKSLRPILDGGSQENTLRPGTENVPGIVGLGVAARERCATLESSISYMAEIRDRFEGLVLESVAGARINGHISERAPNTTNILFPGVDGQALVAQLDALGIYCSQSSACTSASPEPSYVLRAMGLSTDDAYSSVRFSCSIENTIEEIEEAAIMIGKIAKKLMEFDTLVEPARMKDEAS